MPAGVGVVATEFEDLDQLVHSQGWLRFQNFVSKEWGDQLQQHLLTAANDREDTIALQKIRQVLAAKREIDRMVAWPQERLQQIEQAAEKRELAQTVPLSRRGHTL